MRADTDLQEHSAKRQGRQRTHGTRPSHKQRGAIERQLKAEWRCTRAGGGCKGATRARVVHWIATGAMVGRKLVAMVFGWWLIVAGGGTTRAKASDCPALIPCCLGKVRLGTMTKSSVMHFGDSLAFLRTDIKSQRKLVMEKLVDIVLFLNREIQNVFGNADCEKPSGVSLGDRKRLGPSGLALHYANIVIQIDTIKEREMQLQVMDMVDCQFPFAY
ncbi:D-lactate dehydrogenase [Actinidia rufa]|uniref:D-lactate dehydrogenase n=1 Tax=Actinidia rufa TaxID=165716 RepID=A0A7J0GCY1_9ERIC|nr:D-lactate dehydrogenase [Actinidia rufa]